MVLVGESQSATKKPHKMGKTAEFSAVFVISKNKKCTFKLYFVFSFKSGFCSTLNEADPYFDGKVPFFRDSSIIIALLTFVASGIFCTSQSLNRAETSGS